MLRAVRRQQPQTYLRASRELGLTLERTQSLVERRVQIISAARAIKLGRMAAYEPGYREVFGETGQAILDTMQREANRSLRLAVRTLPRAWRARLALKLMRGFAQGFAGSTNQLIAEPYEEGLIITVRDGVFTDRLDTLGGAYAYYRNACETMLQQFAHIDCEVLELRRPRAHLNQCSFKVVWEA
jgi:hypothetical protein